MGTVLHEIEKKIIASLRGSSPQNPADLVASAHLSIDQVRRGVEWLKMKGLIDVADNSKRMVRPGKNGLEALEKGLPEERLQAALKSGPKPIKDLQDELGPVFGPAMGQAKKLGMARSSGGMVSLAEPVALFPGKVTLEKIGKNRVERDTLPADDIEILQNRPDFIIEDRKYESSITLTGLGKKADISGSGAIDVEAAAPPAYIARTHPLKDVIDEVREAFVALGFSEIRGTLAQPSFWNFDALFTPQDHPAREMQDTFYIDGVTAPKHTTSAQAKNVAASHRKNWKYDWDIKESKRMVLRTHTTCVTIRHLAENDSPEPRVFSLGRVFRNEKPSYKHLAEFHQIEGVVTGSGATLRDLMGIQREFYRRMGLNKVRFWPTFFPYTEPSLQTMVYNERLKKWVELFGMGLFRPEVTRPLGISGPVLAWGGGIERIAMLKYGIDDVREFYSNKLGWLRCR